MFGAHYLINLFILLVIVMFDIDGYTHLDLIFQTAFVDFASKRHQQ